MHPHPEQLGTVNGHPVFLPLDQSAVLFMGTSLVCKYCGAEATRTEAREAHWSVVNSDHADYNASSPRVEYRCAVCTALILD